MFNIYNQGNSFVFGVHECRQVYAIVYKVQYSVSWAVRIKFIENYKNVFKKAQRS